MIWTVSSFTPENLMTLTPYHHGDLKNALIQAGIEILSQEGLQALSLRRVARRAGVSHSAPYAHFADKQALIAAISTEGFRQLYDQLAAAVQQSQGDPLQQLVQATRVYCDFALADSAHFKIMFSGVLEMEDDYPDFVDISLKNFNLVIEIVENCQQAGILKPGPAEELAVTVWGLVHGVVSLMIEGQVSETILTRLGPQKMLVSALNQITIIEIDPQILD
ncbi:MAG TPA: TetR family transcriptional regulator [Chloroflexi bacterium]|nr:TetR family transcriptional regulator [Chloroflexota bacterium]HBY08035.1 TetR family transcriptional regulator [Chloroflexota bacterium]